MNIPEVLEYMASNIRKGLNPKENLEIFVFGEWLDIEFKDTTLIDKTAKYRVKKPTVYTESVKIPKPLSKSPDIGQKVYSLSPHIKVGVIEFDWSGSEIDKTALSRQLVHDNLEDAKSHAKALGWCDE